MILRSRLGLGLALVLATVGCGDDHVVDPLSQKGIERNLVITTADPCQDFYAYACGGFTETTTDGSFIARKSDALFANEDVESSIVNNPQGPAALLVSEYVEACLHANHAQDRSPLTSLIADIDAMTTPDDLGPVLSSLHDSGGDVFFWLSSQHDPEGGPVVASLLLVGGYLPDDAYLDPQIELLDQFRAHITKLGKLTGSVNDARPDAVVKIETALAKARRDGLKKAQASATSKLADLVAATPHLPWTSYLAESKAPPFSQVLVESQTYFKELDALLAEVSLADLKAYLEFIALETYAWTLDDAIVAEETAFYDGHFEGFSTPLPRHEHCLREAAGAIPWPTGQAFVEAAFGSDEADAAARLMKDARAAFGSRLDRAAWLDPATRAAAKTKLAAMRTETGAPSTWPSTDGLVLDSSSFPVSQAAARKLERKTFLAAIGKVDVNPWFMSPFVFNAEYDPELNALDVTAAFLQKPNFDVDFADEVNAGAMASVMGHEMTHGFDAEGRLFDAHGVLRNWWSAKTTSSFEDRSKCLVEQYGKFEAAPNLFVNGKQTLDENIADLGGLNIAFDTLHPTGGDAQAFFIAYAQNHCENDQSEYLESLVETDPHAPPKARVNLVVANMKEFQDAFSCAIDTPMAPKKRCAIW